MYRYPVDHVIGPSQGILKNLLAVLSNLASYSRFIFLLFWEYVRLIRFPGCHILLQSTENIAFLWSLTKLLTVWLWKEEFSPDFRTVCFCLTVQKAHPGRELRS